MTFCTLGYCLVPKKVPNKLITFAYRCNTCTQVTEILSSWHEILLECEAAADDSIDLYHKEKDQTLRAVLINSGYVIGTGNLQTATASGGANHHQNNSALSSDAERYVCNVYN